jgi:D-arabinose 1-dehydrogenase-like Zn-dependent alcohol dehydrogenase
MLTREREVHQTHAHHCHPLWRARCTSGGLKKSAPEPKDGEVRVRVLAADVSYPDLLMREGIHPETPTLPFTPGWDLIGAVDRLGNGVS